MYGYTLEPTLVNIGSRDDVHFSGK